MRRPNRQVKGCRTVGIAGGPDKVRLCREDFRYDSAVDYKADDLEAALDAACPDGVDVYFDNTAGPSATPSWNVSMSKHGWSSAARHPSRARTRHPRDHGSSPHLLVKRARMQGFLIFDHVQRQPEALRELESWVRNGRIRYREDVLDGLEQAPGSIAGLYRGENLGKCLIRIAPDVPG